MYQVPWSDVHCCCVSDGHCFLPLPVPFILVSWHRTFHVVATASPEGATAASGCTLQASAREMQFSLPDKAQPSGTMPREVGNKAGLATPPPLQDQYAQIKQSVPIPLLSVPVTLMFSPLCSSVHPHRHLLHCQLLLVKIKFGQVK